MTDTFTGLPDPSPNSFQGLFEGSGGQPIQYHGQTLMLVDRFSVRNCQKLAFDIVSTNSRWKQGIKIDPDANIRVDGRLFRSVVFWEDTAPSPAIIELEPEVTSLAVSNVWQTADGATDSWHAGAAMICTPTPNGRRYHCNDGDLDADFDDLIFTIERLA